MGGYIGSRAVNLSTTAADVSGNATIGGNLTVSGTTVTIDSANAQTVDLGDNDKIRLGDGDDLQIYHNGSHSYIDDTGTGNLIIRASSALSLQKYTGEIMAQLTADGAVDLYYDNSKKFETTSTGVDISGGLNTTSTVDINGSSALRLRFLNGGTFKGGVQIATSTDDMISGSAANDLAIRSQSNMLFSTGGNTERMRISSSGDVILKAANKLQLNRADDARSMKLFTDNDAGHIQTTNDPIIIDAASGRIRFDIASSEKMRLDSSGNLLVGQTSQATNSTGFSARANSLSHFCRDTSSTGSGVLLLNKKTGNGDVLVIQKDDSTVGSIGSEGGDSLFIQGGTTSGAGLLCHGSAAKLLPVRNNASIDSTIDLGQGSRRFKDLYLSGGAYLGGTTSSNYLTDYEEGTWTPGCTGTLGVQGARYVKVGNYVNLSFYVTFINPTADNNTFKIGGLPFNVKTSSGYYAAGSIGYTGDNNLNDVVILTGTTLDYLYFHLNDGDGGAVTGNEMRARGMTGASLDAMIASISYCSA